MVDLDKPGDAPEPKPEPQASYPPESSFEGTGLEPTKDDKMWAMLAHLSILLGATTVVGPLVIWLLKKDDSQFVDDQGKEALNFQLLAFLASVICGVTCVLAPLIFFIWLAGIVFSIIAAVESNKGNLYRYPIPFRLIK